MKLAAFLPLALAGFCSLTGCSGTYNLFGSGSAVPAGKIQVFPKYGISYADAIQVAGVAALVYLVVDPMAPTWDIKETRLADNRVLYDLTMKKFTRGGEGEARYVLMRRAEALARESGMRGYQIMRYEEAIDSSLILPHRTALAEIVLQGDLAVPRAPSDAVTK